MIDIKSILVKFAVMALPLVLKRVTPTIREKLCEFILEWEKDAEETPNEFDDMLVCIVKILLDIK